MLIRKNIEIQITFRDVSMHWKIVSSYGAVIHPWMDNKETVFTGLLLFIKLIACVCV